MSTIEGCGFLRHPHFAGGLNAWQSNEGGLEGAGIAKSTLAELDPQSFLSARRFDDWMVVNASPERKFYGEFDPRTDPGPVLQRRGEAVREGYPGRSWPNVVVLLDCCLSMMTEGSIITEFRRLWAKCMVVSCSIWRVGRRRWKSS